MCTPEDFRYVFGVMAELKARWPRAAPENINMSTMTVIAKAARATTVNLSRVARVDEEDFYMFRRIGRLHPECPEARLRLVVGKKRLRKVGQFGNQATLAFTSLSDRSIKVFSNGKLHVTGCKNLEEFRRVGQAVGGLLFAVGAIDGRLTLQEAEVPLLNFNFTLNLQLSLQALWEVVVQQLRVPLSHETESHPALLVRLGFATVMIFRSGHVLVSSKTQLHGVLASFRLVCQLVEDNYERVLAPVSLRKRKAAACLVIDGYRTGQVLPCLEGPCYRRGL